MSRKIYKHLPRLDRDPSGSMSDGDIRAGLKEIAAIASVEGLGGVVVFTPGKAWDPKYTQPLTDHDKKVIELHENLHRDYHKIHGKKASLSDKEADAAVEKVLSNDLFIIITDGEDG